jgi:hypothetical protein
MFNKHLEPIADEITDILVRHHIDTHTKQEDLLKLVEQRLKTKMVTR